MRTKLATVSMAAIIAVLVGAGPSFGQASFGAGGSSPGGGGAPAAGGGGAPTFGGGRRGGGGRQGGTFGGTAGGGGRHWSGNRHHRGFAGPYFGGGFWGGPYAYDEYIVGPGPEAGVAYCMRRYRSYDPGSGTYLGFDGLRHPCP